MKTSFNIPFERSLLYLLAAGLLPFFFAALHFASDYSTLKLSESALQAASLTALEQERKHAHNFALRHNYHDSDHFYIDKQLETLIFLETEIESLQRIAANKHVGQTEAITKRLAQLTGTANSLQFSEGTVQSYPYFQETLETLSHPVEIDLNDLHRILAKTEGVSIGSYSSNPNRPQLIITEFKLDKKQVRSNSEVFQLHLKLLKREFL